MPKKLGKAELDKLKLVDKKVSEEAAEVEKLLTKLKSATANNKKLADSLKTAPEG